MRYLLDVNVLVALGYTGHALHMKAAGWYAGIAKLATGLHTCAITELGFVRVSVVLGLQPDVASARRSLDALKSSSQVRFEIVADDLGAAHLPSFVKSAQSITDGHLLELAKKHSMKLVTLDRGIPGAIYIG
jgi:predicted nucleic acid-binding protein